MSLLIALFANSRCSGKLEPMSRRVSLDFTLLAFAEVVGD